MSEYKYTLMKFVKDWMLLIGMVAGSSLYLIYHKLEFIHCYGPTLLKTIQLVQPILIFCMLFLTFLKIKPGDLKLEKWHLWLLLVQGGMFLGFAMVLIFIPDLQYKAAIEGTMLCFLCPTATACSVVTAKLGGNIAGVLSYTLMVNLLVAITAPLLLPLIHPMEGLDFWIAFRRIISKIFPMLIMPCFAAWIVRYCTPKLHAKLIGYTELSFYLFAVSLTLAIVSATRTIVANEKSSVILGLIAAGSLVSCAIQFWLGKRIGAGYGCKITSGQSLGQKNTVFAMWLGYTFLDPITSVAGGIYSIWHNCYNTWQLYKTRKRKEEISSC